ncbi:MAG: hypothetical protein H6858_08575 [Rhodospirillales bacterium]|nr:hypothetical protein [Alphaproteobacteria bacterium]MCB1838716.1 hypothetical protein [Alphaproteobacteria bacterium]MCB9977636.1 hypothetical protein [Rhodospirillales bacterium]
MNLKPTLFLDTDSINDLFGRPNFNAATGNKIMNALAEHYDIRTTSAVIEELLNGRTYGTLRAEWFKENATIHNTPLFEALVRNNDPVLRKNAGERSIASVIDPGFRDRAFSADGITPGTTTYHDPLLPALGNTKTLILVSRDQGQYTGQNVASNFMTTSEFLRKSLLANIIDTQDYDAIHNNTDSGWLGRPNARASNTEHYLPTAGVIWHDSVFGMSFPEFLQESDFVDIGFTPAAEYRLSERLRHISASDDAANDLEEEPVAVAEQDMG